MKIRNFTHKGLRRLYGEDNAKGVPAAAVDKLRKMLAFLDGVDDPGNFGHFLHGRPICCPGTAREPGV
jgi:plasmid maintenance system killer protein